MQLSRKLQGVTKSPYLLLVLASIDIYNFTRTIKKDFSMEMDFNFIWNEQLFNSILHIITVIILFFIYKGYLSTKQSIKYSNDHWYNEINKLSAILTKNINDSLRYNDLKIRYIDFKNTYTNLTEDELRKKLINNGFTQDDLKELGV